MAKFKFSFRIKFRYSPDAQELDEWKAAFSRASQVFYHATEGQLQLGKITVELYSPSPQPANVAMYQCCGTSVGNPTNVAICRDEKTKPLVILHELSHHFFDVRDEYVGYSGNGCTKSPSNQACIMEFSSQGDRMKNGAVEMVGLVNQYCRPANHTAANAQQLEHEESCIETIRDCMTGHGIVFDLPTASLGAMTASEPAGHEPVNWQPVKTGSKHVVVVDNSRGLNGSMLAEAQRIGARFWIDHFTGETDQIGFVAGDGRLIYPMQEIDENKNREAIEAINGLDFESDFDPLSSIIAANEQIRRSEDEPPPEVSHQSITFVSTVDVADVFDPEQQIELGNRISLIDVGARAARFGMDRISRLTGGNYHNIGQASDEQTAFAIQNRIIELALNTSHQNGLALHEQATISRWEDDGKAPEAEENSGEEANRDSDPVNPVLEYSVLVEKGCAEATFVVSKEKPEDLEVEIIGPDDSPIDQDKIERIERLEYSIVKVKEPIRGAWRIKIRRRKPGDKFQIKVLASITNPELSLHVKTLPLKGEPGIHLMASAEFGSPLVGIEEPVVEIYETSPDREPGAFVVKTTLAPFQADGPDNKFTPRGYEPVYHRKINLPPGIYNMVVRFVNAGAGKQSGTCTEGCPTEKEKSAQKAEPAIKPVSNFIRIFKRQIVVLPAEE